MPQVKATPTVSVVLPVYNWRVARLYQELYRAYVHQGRLAAGARRLVQADFQRQLRRLAQRNAPLPKWLQGSLTGIYLGQKVQQKAPFC